MTRAETEQVVRAALERLRVFPNQVIELRGLDIPTQYGRPLTAAGCFDDMDALAAAAVRLEARRAQVYVTLNPVNPALLCRACNRVIDRPKAATADHDIVRRVWLPFDIDAVRPSGTSASESELAEALERSRAIATWLTDTLGESPSIWGFSGNGHHLLYRIDLPNDESSTAQIRGLLHQTSQRFSNARVRVDETVFNAARIWRLYGTLNRKGDAVARLGRVHRRAAIVEEGFA